VRRVEGDPQFGLDARLGHGRPEALLAELIERLLAYLLKMARAKRRTRKPS
jgi:hypothetical protein